VQWIESALEFAWKLPRYEADEFAAAFVAANKSRHMNRLLALLMKKFPSADDEREIDQLKDTLERISKSDPDLYLMDDTGGGEIRLITPATGDTPTMDAAAYFAADIQYRYEIRGWDGELHVKAFEINYTKWRTENEIFAGTLAEMKGWAKEAAK